jgi:hypothetical protein
LLDDEYHPTVGERAEPRSLTVGRRCYDKYVSMLRGHRLRRILQASVRICEGFRMPAMTIAAGHGPASESGHCSGLVSRED